MFQLGKINRSEVLDVTLSCIKKTFYRIFRAVANWLEHSKMGRWGERTTKYVTLCTIRCHLYNFKNRSSHGGVLLLVVLKVTDLHGCFFAFFNYTKGT